MSEPTAAGPTTVAGLDLYEGIAIRGMEVKMARRIAAIEAEAAAAARTALLDELEAAMRALVEHAPCVSMDSGSTVDRTDVLAEINRRRP